MKNVYFVQIFTGHHTSRCYIRQTTGQEVLNLDIIKAYLNLRGSVLDYGYEVKRLDEAYPLFELPMEKDGATVGYESAVKEWKIRVFRNKINFYGELVH